MAQLDMASATTPTEITDFTTESSSTDSASNQKETRWYNSLFNKWYGLYLKRAKAKITINAWVTFVVGKGISSTTHQTEIDNMNFLHIMWNMLVIKKVNGDSFAEIIRNENGTLLDLKPLDPASIVSVWGTDGLIDHYEQISNVEGKENEEIAKEKILHMMNDRVADNIHGTSVLEAVEWNLNAQEEARLVHRKKVKNSGIIGIIEADTQDTTKIAVLKEPLKTGTEKGNFLIVPKDVIGIKPWEVKLNTADTIAWINHLEDEMFMLMGIPKPIVGGAQSGEGDTKMSYLAFEQYYTRAIEELKEDLWDQLAMRIEVETPVSIKDDVQDTQAKNTNEVGFQPNDTNVGVQRE